MLSPGWAPYHGRRDAQVTCVVGTMPQDGQVTTATTVPVTTDMDGDELNAEDAWHTVRRHGLKALFVESFLRFRFGDGFTNSRALGLQMALSLLPFLLALTGLAAGTDDGRAAQVVARTVTALTPGSEDAKAINAALRPGESGDDVGDVALGLGLAFALASMTTALAQVERGSNRIYGIRRDRSAVRKYGRAAVLTSLLAGPAGVGFLLLVAGGPLGEALTATYGWSEQQHLWWNVVRWPVGLAVITLTIAVLLDHSPRRRQPGLSWLALGASVAVVITMASSGMLALYVRYSGSFGNVYGPLAGVVALLLWCYVSSIALFAGTAMAAQLEALRAGVEKPVLDDPGPTDQRERVPDERGSRNRRSPRDVGPDTATAPRREDRP